MIVLGSLSAQTNLSPLSAATAQTFGSYSRGLDAVNWNPASLAYKYRIKIKTELQELPEPKAGYRIHILNTTSTVESDSMANQIRDILFKDSLFVNLQAIEEDSAYSIRINDIINHTTAEFYLRLLNEHGYTSARIDTFVKSIEQIPQVEKYQYEKEKRFHLELVNMGAMLSNSSVDVNWINTYILNGGTLGELDDGIKNDVTSVFPDDGWGLNPLINYKFGLRIKNFALQLSPDVYSELVIPSGLFDLVFWGNEISEPIDLSGRKNQFQVVLPVSISYGRQVNLPLLNNFVDRSYFGVSAKYLVGLAYFESAFDTLSITSYDDQISIQADIKTKYSLAGAYMEVDTGKSFNYYLNDKLIDISLKSLLLGNPGYAFDLGLIMNISDKLSSSIAITNLLGQITWGNQTVYEHKLKLKSEIAIEEETQDQLDSLLQAGIKIDTNITVTSFQTKYPGILILGTEYSLDKIKLATNLKFGFSNELGSSTIPRLSLGIELRPLNWLSLLGGTSVGGYEGVQWGSGISMRLLFLQFAFSYAEYGGMLNSAKGFSLSASTSLVF